MPSKGTPSNAVMFEIIDFNHDQLSTGGTAGITFATKYIPTVKGAFKMNNSAVNNGGYPNSAGFNKINSEVYNEVFTDEVKAVAKEVKKLCYVDGSMETINAKVFLFSTAEVNVSDPDGYPGNEGSPYAAFTDRYSRKKEDATGNPPSPSGTSRQWWLRTCSFYHDGTFAYVTEDGTTMLRSANDSKYMCFGFCV